VLWMIGSRGARDVILGFAEQLKMGSLLCGSKQERCSTRSIDQKELRVCLITCRTEGWPSYLETK
jgi:hypothetical protein